MRPVSSENVRTDRRVARGAAAGMQGKESEHDLGGGSGADGPRLRDKLTRPHVLLPVGQELSDPTCSLTRIRSTGTACPGAELG